MDPKFFLTNFRISILPLEWILTDILQATSAGSKEQEAINFLEKKMKNDPAFTYEETVQVYCLYTLCMVKEVAKDHMFDMNHICLMFPIATIL